MSEFHICLFVGICLSSSASTTASRISFGSLDATRRKSCASITSETSDSMHTIASGDSTQTTVTSSVSQVDITLSQEEPAALQDPPSVPDGVIDFDRENWDDPFQASHYAMDIFSYLKERESLFKVDYYMERQPQLTPWMRTLLVDWMVEVQETFELNHETLYLAVKIVDIYLSKVTVERDQLQLLGAAALFISCKYDVSHFQHSFVRSIAIIYDSICTFAGTHSTVNC